MPMLRCFGACAASLVLLAAAARADVVRVDMQNATAFDGRNAVDFTGVETQAAAADSLFGSNGVNAWNYLTAPAAGSTPATNPSFTDLLDSAGVATGIGISFTGSIVAANDSPIDNSGSDGFENDYFLTCPGNSVDYTISGLQPGTQYAFYNYAPNFTLHDSGCSNTSSRAFQLTANGQTITVPSGPNDNALSFVTADANGDIAGVWSTINGNEANWSGFQLASVPPASSVPEPATLTVLAAGMLGLFGARRRRV